MISRAEVNDAFAPPLRIESAAQTNVGRVRRHNEDCYAVVDELGLYLVADGMGGHASGDVASRMAIELVTDFFASTSEDPDLTWPYRLDTERPYDENRLVVGIKLANREIYQTAQNDPSKRGMGTTIVGMLVFEDVIYIAHVGDSRVYRIRNEGIEQLTEDHSLLNEYLKLKPLSREEIACFPQKNVIVRGLGLKETVNVDTRVEIPRAGDIYVLCSDGLSGPVSDAEILDIVAGAPALRSATSRLIQQANDHGGPDNVSVVLARWA